MRRIAAIVLASLVGAGIVAAPAAADADGVTLDCTYNGGPDTWYGYTATVTEGGAPYSGPATVEINADPGGANVWVSSSVDVVNGEYSSEVNSFFDGHDAADVGIRVTAGAATDTCWAAYDPVLVDYSGSLTITAGDTAAILADVLPSSAVSGELMRASLMVKSGSSWVAVADTSITAFGNYGVLTYRPSYSRDAYIEVYSAEDDRYLGSSASFVINVKRTTPTVITRPSSVVQGRSATIVAAYGDASTAGTAYLQVLSGSTWKTVSSKSFSRGVVTFTRSESVTSKYRIAFKPAGKSTVYTASWTMSYLPQFSMTSPGTVKRGSWVDIRVANRADTSGTIKVQYYAAGAWHTYRTYHQDARQTFWMSIQIKATYKWRIVYGSYASPSLTVHTK
jgi:hypothetical protein